MFLAQTSTTPTPNNTRNEFDRDKINELIGIKDTGLDHEKFQVRERATEELKKLI